MTRTIDYLPVADLQPDPRNPKDHDVGLIHTSVGRFGFVEPIIIDGRTGLIVSGHGRVKALQAMEAEGDPPPEGIGVDETTGRWHVPVVTGWQSRSDADAAAALIALNRTTEMGGWVDESLLELLETLAGEQALDGVGYDLADLEALRALAETSSYYDSDEYVDKAFADAAAEHRSIKITGVPVDVWDWWTTLPGAEPVDKLRGLMDG